MRLFDFCEARLCVGVCERSRRRGDGVQVLHQALEVGHLLGQLVGLVALRERNRVTARGRGRAGGQGGKHLEARRGGGEGREERGGEERVSQGSFAEERGRHMVWVRRAGDGRISGTDKHKQSNQ